MRLLILLVTLCGTDVLHGEIMVEFQINQPGTTFHGATFTTHGVGETVWGSPVPASNQNRGNGYIDTGIELDWSLTVSGVTGNGEFWNGLYEPVTATGEETDPFIRSFDSGILALMSQANPESRVSRPEWRRVGGTEIIRYNITSIEDSMLGEEGQSPDFLAVNPIIRSLVAAQPGERGESVSGLEQLEFRADHQLANLRLDSQQIPEPTSFLPLLAVTLATGLLRPRGRSDQQLDQFSQHNKSRSQHQNSKSESQLTS